MKTKLSPSLRKMLIMVTCLSVAIFIAAGSFLISSFSSATEVNNQQFSDFLNTQLEIMNEELYTTNIYLMDSMMNNKNILDINSATTIHERNQAARKLSDDFEYRQKYYNQNVSFSFWSPAKLVSVNSFDTSYSYTNSQKLAAHMRFIGINGNAGNFFHWNYQVVNGEVYLVQLYVYAGNYICAWIPCNLLFAPLIENTYTQELIFLDKNEMPILAKDREKNARKDAEANLSHEDFSFTGKLDRAELGLFLTATTSLDFTALILPLFFVVVVIVIVLSFSGFTLFYFKHNFADPLKAFQAHIGSYSTVRKNLRGTGFSELSGAVDVFDDLNEQLNELKIDIYEEQLARAKTELDFFQQQIKPHFFLNCFSIIYGMAQKKDFDRIQQFCLKLSSYVRYLFNDGFSQTTLAEELRHIGDYLELQSIRHHTEISFQDRVESSLKDFRIPPLLLMSFVENCVKYSRRDSDSLIIALEIKKQEGGILFCITDNGAGFSKADLEALSNLDALASGKGEHHIGTINTIRRLRLIYGARFSLEFSNRAEGGSCVKITLPEKTTMEGESV